MKSLVYRLYHFSFLTLRLGFLLNAGWVLAEEEQRIPVYLAPDDSMPALVFVSSGEAQLANSSSVVDDQLAAEGWRTTTWAGPLMGYVPAGSSNKQLTLNAGTIVYQEPALDSAVIVMVDDKDERESAFQVVGLEDDWEIVSFNRSLQVYFKNPNAEKNGDFLSSNSSTSEKPALTGTVTIQNGWVVASSEVSIPEEQVSQDLLKDATASSALSDSNASDTALSVNSKDINALWEPVDSEHLTPSETSTTLDNSTSAESSVVEEECPEPMPVKRPLPPIDQDPLARQAPKTLPSPACLMRQLNGVLVKCPITIGLCQAYPYALKDCYGRTIAYLKLCDMSPVDICKYLNRPVIVKGIVNRTSPGKPLTMEAKVIRLRR